MPIFYRKSILKSRQALRFPKYISNPLFKSFLLINFDNNYHSIVHKVRNWIVWSTNRLSNTAGKPMFYDAKGYFVNYFWQTGNDAFWVNWFIDLFKHCEYSSFWILPCMQLRLTKMILFLNQRRSPAILNLICKMCGSFYLTKVVPLLYYNGPVK